MITFFRDPLSFLDGNPDPDAERKYYDALGSQLASLCQQLQPHDIRIGFHCYDIDFAPLRDGHSGDTTSGLQLLLEKVTCPSFTIQLDTYFLMIAHWQCADLTYDPLRLAAGRISSVHVTDVDIAGSCVPVGDGLCPWESLVPQIMALNRSVRWILELDPELPQAPAEKQEMITKSKNYWEQNAARLQRPAPRVSCAEMLELNQEKPDVTLRTEASMARARFLTCLGREYMDEITDAVTEDLFGAGPHKGRCLTPLELGSPRVPYYVTKRCDMWTGLASESHAAESEFHALYWPLQGIRSPQLLLICGKEGVGKSTFLQYYFRHFLPYYNKLECYNEITDGERKEWPSKAKRHLVLCADLYGVRTTKDMHATIIASFFRQLREFPGLPLNVLDPKLGDATPHDSLETMLRGGIAELARAKQMSSNRGERKHFITWVFDNTDLMPEEVQVDLLTSAVRCVAVEMPEGCPYAPVDADENALWKVIVPVRRETYLRIHAELEEIRNKHVWDLSPVCWPDLDKTRGQLLAELVMIV